jgi:predicted acylesterase/phospholipase RssA
MERSREDTPAPELRLALVINGGVSLAVWISGVVHEIDRLRRASADGTDDTAGYRDALGSGRAARVDVIAGASAGGINGAVLAAAIQGGTSTSPKKLEGPGGTDLRDVWLDVGDLGRLIRSTRDPEPSSLLRGDDYFLPKLEEVLGGLLAEKTDLDHPLYLYLTSTALRSHKTARFDTSDEAIKEPDHRITLRFSAVEKGEIDEATVPARDGDMATELPLDASQAGRLARAARSSSSFPGAFPPHAAVFPETKDTPERPTFLIDGGILDNQPFNPVLDRISVMPVTKRWDRVVLYVVPYVTEEAKSETGKDRPEEVPPGIAEVVAASGLARDLAKLTSLERVEAMRSEGERAAKAADALLDPEQTKQVVEAAAWLFRQPYRRVQADELTRTLEEWRASPPSVGTGPQGGRETDAAAQVLLARQFEPDWERLPPMLPPENWAEARVAWKSPDGRWCWGLTKAERFSRATLHLLRDGDGPAFEDARARATRLIHTIREAMAVRRAAFYTEPYLDDPVSAFATSHEAITGWLDAVDDQLEALLASAAPLIESATTGTCTRDELYERLAAAEVVANASGTRALAPPTFRFYRISAGEPVLGHPATTPEQKLAGMKLGHFAAFLKHSWRANDWMWGRLDAVTWLAKVLGADATWVKERQLEILREELPKLATAVDSDERSHFSATADLALWRLKHADAIERLVDAPDAEVRKVFADCVLRDDRIGEELGSRGGVAIATRLAAVASRALSAAGSGFPGPVRGLVGTTRRAAGLTSSLAVTFARNPALGVAVVLVIAALAVILAETGSSGAAWLSPALAAIALLAAWTGYGWLSSPPTPARAVLLLAALAALVVVNALTFLPPDAGSTLGTWFAADSFWDVLWWLVCVGSLAGVGLLLFYFAGALKVKGVRAGIAVRGWLGFALLFLLAAPLTRYVWDRVTDRGDNSVPAWIEFFEKHEVVQIGLVVFVIGCLLIPLAELLSVMHRGLRRAARDRRGARTRDPQV